jgi:Na+/melibiose symporter-like transporter
MNGKHIKGSLNFIIIVLLLLVVSLVGIIAPESVSRLQGSNPLKWSVAILCGLIFSYILVWLSNAVADGRNLQSKSRSHYIRESMIKDLRRVLYFQPLLVLLIGWILGWGVNRIVGIVSFLNFVTVCASFFRGLRLWELNEKEHRASLQT